MITPPPTLLRSRLQSQGANVILHCMRILAHTRFRVDSVFYFFGYSEFVPGRKQPIISPRATLQVNPGDVIEKISISHGFWIKDIECEIPDHPLLIDERSGRYILNTGPELMKYKCPIEIKSLLTIEELYDY